MNQTITKPKAKEVTPAEIQKRFGISDHILSNLIELAERDKESLAQYVARRLRIEASHHLSRFTGPLSPNLSQEQIDAKLKKVESELRSDERALFSGFGINMRGISLLKADIWHRGEVDLKEQARRTLKSCSEHWEQVQVVCYDKQIPEAEKHHTPLTIKAATGDRIEIHLPKSLHDRYVDMDRDLKETLMVALSSSVKCMVGRLTFHRNPTNQGPFSKGGGLFHRGELQNYRFCPNLRVFLFLPCNCCLNCLFR